jgi:hypothetical protein
MKEHHGIQPAGHGEQQGRVGIERRTSSRCEHGASGIVKHWLEV